MYAAGLRASEVIALRQRNLDLQHGLVTCFGKGRKERTVPIGKSAISALTTYIATKRFPPRPTSPSLLTPQTTTHTLVSVDHHRSLCNDCNDRFLAVESILIL
jgi:site-specific recombinase XerD